MSLSVLVSSEADHARRSANDFMAPAGYWPCYTKVFLLMQPLWYLPMDRIAFMQIRLRLQGNSTGSREA
jgi:hypothetical protein